MDRLKYYKNTRLNSPSDPLLDRFDEFMVLYEIVSDNHTKCIFNDNNIFIIEFDNDIVANHKANQIKDNHIITRYGYEFDIIIENINNNLIFLNINKTMLDA